MLPSAWVQLTGVPEDFLEKERLMAAFSMVGRAIDVDELSLLKWETESVRVRFQCRYPERIKGSVQVFVNGEGFTIGVHAERGPWGGSGSRSGAPPPPPPRPDRDNEEDYSDDGSTDNEWNKHGRRKKPDQ
jgi:hypothetical protein